MRIVQVSVGSVRMPPSEGSAPLQVIFNTSKHLARMGHDVVIIDRKYSRQDADIDEVEGVKIVRLKVKQIPLIRAPGLIRFVLAELNAVIFALSVGGYLWSNRANIDIIHLHLTSTGLIICTFNKLLCSKMIYTCHLSQWALAPLEQSIFVKMHLFIDAFLMKRVNKVIALNEAAKNAFVTVGKVREGKIVIIPNGVDTAFFCPDIVARDETKRKYGMEDKIVILYVGRLTKIKGVDHLVNTANIVVKDFEKKDAIFIFIGSTAFSGVDPQVNMGAISAYVNSNRLQNNISFIGSLALAEVRELYNGSDIFVLPSLAEGDPLVTLEAMASSLPVIATRVGGIPNQIHDGWNGFLVDPGDVQQMADKIRDLIDKPELRQQMGENSRKYAEEEFDWGMITKKVESLYEKISNLT